MQPTSVTYRYPKGDVTFTARPNGWFATIETREGKTIVLPTRFRRAPSFETAAKAVRDATK